MRVKERDLLVGLVISPVILIVIAVIIIVSAEKSKVINEYNLDNQKFTSFYDLINKQKVLDELTEPVINELIQNSRSSVRLLDDKTYLADVNRRLEPMFSFLLTDRTDFLDQFNQSDAGYFQGKCLEYRVMANKGDSVRIKRNNNEYLLKVVAYTSQNNKVNYIYVITKLSVKLPYMTRIQKEILFSTILIILIMSIVILLVLYYYIIKPIKILNANVKGMEQGFWNNEMEACNGKVFAGLSQELYHLQQTLVEENDKREQTDALTKEVIGNISHDLKTPLTAIKGYAEGIIDGVAKSPDQIDRYVRTIYNKAVDMNILVDELAFFTRINQNDLPYKFTSVSVNQYISECLSSMATDLDMKKIQLIFKNMTNIDTKVIIDVEKIKRVIHNIVGNATKYIGRDNGIIYVSIEDYGDMVLVRIEDNGTGISPKELPHIFDRFYRTDSSRNSKTGGSGLGLAIAQKIILDHGGKIWAESKENVGTALIFTLKKSLEE